MNRRTAKLLARFAAHFGYDPAKVKQEWKQTPAAKRARAARIVRSRMEEEPRADGPQARRASS